jgi:predicted nucleic acid-binding protein
MIFADTNVLVDVVTNNPIWESWSLRQLEDAALRDRLVIDPVVYAELSIGFAQPGEVDAVLATADISVVEAPRSALFLAGKVFREYRKRGGGRTGVLPDFFIGAHAAVLGAPLITRDARRYRTYFPAIALIAPE